MKSVMFYESDDESKTQDVQLLGQREILEKLKSLCSEKWGGHRDWTFSKWWEECWEDLWNYIKADEKVMTATKIKTGFTWYEKNMGIEKIYADMEALVDGFLAEWHADHPEPPEVEEEDLDEEEVLGEVVERIESEDYLA